MVPVCDFPFVPGGRQFGDIYIDPKYRGTNRRPTLPGGFLFVELPDIPKNDPALNMCPQCGRAIKMTQSLCNIALSGKPCYSMAYKTTV